jgi:hypothetical protein
MSSFSDPNNLLDRRVATLLSNEKNEKENFYGTVLCYDNYFKTYTVQFDDGNYMNRLSDVDVLKMIKDLTLQGIN